jgi:SAM-dependent methyltransferase
MLTGMSRVTTTKLYWLGNAAKAKCIGEILRTVCHHPAGDILVFDYGCGNGGDWPSILADYPSIHLIGYDPSVEMIRAARTRLKGFNAKLLTGDELDVQQFKAHFIVSFSVLEHVYHRKTYLQTAKKHLRDDGTFYLNYDDGHFRNCLDLSRPEIWLQQIRGWLHNVLAYPLARLGIKSNFQARVERLAIDQLIAALGFRVVDVYYSNLTNFKRLYRTLPDDRCEAFMRLWMSIEDELNSRFLVESKEASLGDKSNLWRFMGSRTLVLQHM